MTKVEVTKVFNEKDVTIIVVKYLLELHLHLSSCELSSKVSKSNSIVYIRLRAPPSTEWKR